MTEERQVGEWDGFRPSTGNGRTAGMVHSVVWDFCFLVRIVVSSPENGQLLLVFCVQNTLSSDSQVVCSCLQEIYSLRW